jgi:hypothetical protein
MTYEMRAAIHYLVDCNQRPDGLWTYYADETRAWYVVTEVELHLLGEMIAKFDSRATAYSQWCSLTTARPVKVTLAADATAALDAGVVYTTEQEEG